jgi:subtilase family serine protease
MRTWEQFLESKKPDTSKIDCIVDIAKALQGVFKDYTLNTRSEAWRRISSKKGENKIHELLKTPSRSLSPFRTLVP